MAIVVSAAIETSQAEAGARRFNASLSTMRREVGETDRALASLTSGLRLLVGALGVAKLAEWGKQAVQAADSFLQLKARIALVAYEGTSVESLMAGIADAAVRARVPVAELTGVYQKNANALKDLKFSQQDGIRVAETLAKVVKISGVDAQQASAGMLQLSQAIASGKFQGDEFRSVSENIPEVLRILQKETGKTATELRKLAEEGKLTGKTLTQALLNASADVDAKFSTLPKTAGEALSAATDAITMGFAKAAETSGLSKAWAEAFDQIREGAGGSAMQSAFKVFADLLTSAGRGFSTLLATMNEARLSIAGWTAAIQDTTSYRALAAVVEKLGAAFAWVKGVASDFGSYLLETNRANNPELYASFDRLAEKASKATEELRVFEQLKGTLTNNMPKIEASEPKKAKVELGRGNVDDEIKKLKKLIETEHLANEIALARSRGDEETARALENQLEIHQKITKEMREADPLLAKKLEGEIRYGNELKKVSEIMARNRELGERFASTLTSGIRDAVAAGKSLGATFKDVLLKMIDMATQALILEPLIKKIGASFGASMGGTDVTGAASKGLFGLFGIGGGSTGPATTEGWGAVTSSFSGDAGLGSWLPIGFAKGGHFANGDVFNTPRTFSFANGTQLGELGEAGPEAIMPLRRGPDGRLGVAAAGMAAAPSTAVNFVQNFNVNGNPDKDAIALMEVAARRAVADATPGIVKASENRVAQRHRADANYLRR